MRTFLRSFTNDKGIPIYMEAIKMMCNNNEQSIAVGFIDISNTNEQLAVYLADYPVITLDILNQVQIFSLRPCITHIGPRGGCLRGVQRLWKCPQGVIRSYSRLPRL